jgi:ectoine hydroxylase-related dioxygenase (phytanoyl-CoA dioxygenase family)
MTHIGYFDPDACDIAEFETLIDRKTAPSTVPHASSIQSEVPIYDVASLDIDRALMAEWANVLMHGAGIVVLKNAYADTTVLDEATAVYQRIITAENGAGGADHFAASGANDRVWNSLEKLCFAAPDVFLRYFANPAIAAVSEAWLGPNYQMTAQVNLVHPGGAAQLAHRDYHLGFQSADVSCAYPAHVHDLSPALTLQGAIAHCNMPVESGPTKILPFSQTYRAGYAAWRRDDFRALFEDRYIQLPLAKGDAVFFNPALFHGAGANSSADIHRMANLLQVSSAFGRAMETVNRRGMSKALYPHAVAAKDRLSSAEMAAAIGACAEGYSFPTNLDHDPPTGGLAPETQAALFARALNEGMDQTTFETALDAMAGRQLS